MSEKHLKITFCVLVPIVLGLIMVYCIIHVGELNHQASVADNCLRNTPNELKDVSCRKHPPSKSKASDLRGSARLFGSIGWFNFFVLIVGVGGGGFKLLTDTPEDG